MSKNSKYNKASFFEFSKLHLMAEAKIVTANEPNFIYTHNIYNIYIIYIIFKQYVIYIIFKAIYIMNEQKYRGIKRKVSRVHSNW